MYFHKTLAEQEKRDSKMSSSVAYTLVREIVTQEDSLISWRPELLYPYAQEVTEIKLEFPRNFVEKIRDIIENVFKNTLLSIGFDYDAYYKLYVKIIVNSRASEAIKKWDNLIDKLREERIDIPVFVNWLGETNLTPEELGYRIGIILAKMNVGLVTEQPVDVSEIVESLRE